MRLSIAGCHFGNFCFEESGADEFFTCINRFEHLEIINCDLVKTTFDHRQIPMLLGAQSRKAFNEFEFIEKVDWGDRAEIDKSVRIASTIRFILDKSHIELDRDAMANAKYRAALASKNDFWGRFVNRLFGAFIMPKRLLVLVVVVIMVFALGYMTPWCHFKTGGPDPVGLEFSDAIYYSGVTFSTIGYGDITPVGPARFLSVLEGITGVTLMSSFVVALTRKYVD